MFDKFTDRARKVVQLANSEARRLRHEYLGAEHILLGLVKEGSGVAAYVLKDYGVNLPDLRAEIDKCIAAGPEPYTIGPDDKLPQHPDATRVLHAAVAEAQSLSHDYVGTEHILLGLLREQYGVVTHVMANLALKIDAVRQTVLDLLGYPRHACGIEQVPCAVCGKPSSPVDCRCDNCWEVERRLASYTGNPAGRAWVEAMLHPPVAEPAELRGDYSPCLASRTGRSKIRPASRARKMLYRPSRWLSPTSATAARSTCSTTTRSPPLAGREDRRRLYLQADRPRSRA